MVLNLTGGESTRVQCQDFVVEAVEPTLTLFDQLRLETAVAVAGYVNIELGRFGLDRFLALPIAPVPSATPITHVRLIPEVCRQLGFQRTLDDPFGQLSEQAMLPENIFRVSIIFEEFI